MTTKLELGDVIKSKYFVYGWKEDFSKDIVDVSSIEIKRIEGRAYFPQNVPAERVTLNPDEEKRRVDRYLVDLSVIDESRKKALYVVEQLCDMPDWTGSTEMNGLEGGLLVHARRLNEDKTYNRIGELLRFYASGMHQNTLYDFCRVGKMQMTFLNFHGGK